MSWAVRNHRVRLNKNHAAAYVVYPTPFTLFHERALSLSACVAAV